MADTVCIGFRPHLLLVLLCLLLYLPGLSSVPPLDRDESRFAQASRQMIESGDYVTVRFQDELRAKKPAGIYWLQAAAARVTGAEDAIWPYRLPSVLGAISAVLLTFAFGRLAFGAMPALIGGALLASTLDLVAEAHQATADAVLLVTIVAAQAILGRVYLAARGTGSRPPAWLVLGFWIAQGAGILVKGPVTPAVSLLTIAALWFWDRRVEWLRQLRPAAGCALVLTIVLPWAIAVSLATKGAFIGQAVNNDLLSKLISGQEAHGAPPGSYLALSPLLLWPISIWAFPALIAAWRRRGEPAIRFCLAWVIPSWLMFELVPTKLPHYVLPCIPALALLAGAALAGPATLLRNRWTRLYTAIALVEGIVFSASLVLAPERAGAGIMGFAVLAGITALLASLAGPVLTGRTRFAAVLAVLLGAVMTYAAAFAGAMPRLDPLWISRDIARSVPAGTSIIVSGYDEPSLVFLLGTGTPVVDGASAGHYLLGHPGAEAAIEQAQEPAFLASLANSGKAARRLAEIDGLDYSVGRKIHIGLWEASAAP